MPHLRTLILSLVIGAFLWFSLQAGYGMWRYSRLSALVPVEIQKWSVEQASAKFLLAASYTYVVEGQSYTGKTIFYEPAFLNSLSAEAQRAKWAEYQYQAWYNPTSPGDSSLQKLFPYKRGAYALLVLCILGYLATHFFKGKTE